MANRCYPIDLRFEYYIFLLIHKTLPIPALKAEIARKVIRIEDIANLVTTQVPKY